ncbi:DUF3021 domain-containing protein [Clostridium vincentii]|uniref:DUF3021 domain-containing protein n=1 Tax=Clostridium vincentii TaxID=52704 RepID=A0A2T0BBH1_9CLOT|nr:DUF3021 domain-containing protein [Clostridium vincentii]PRR81249.1 hypothetical protein CLVI_26610 [Clostridium vincentii]
MTMKKALLRGILGIPIGVFISTTIALVISLFYGEFSPTSLELIQETGSELNATIIQYGLSCLLGFVCSAASAIFEIDSWGMTRQTFTHFIILSLVFFPVSIFSKWVIFDFISIAKYFALWFFLYVVIWIAQYIFWKIKTKELNKRINIK